VRTGAYATSPLTVLVKRINDMKTPDFLDEPSAEPDPRFYRFVELNRKLISAGVVNWVADPRKEVAFDILITGYAPTYSEQVREYLTLLGLPMSKEESEDIVVTGFISMIPICAPRCFNRRCGFYGPSA